MSNEYLTDVFTVRHIVRRDLRQAVADVAQIGEIARLGPNRDVVTRILSVGQRVLFASS